MRALIGVVLASVMFALCDGQTSNSATVMPTRETREAFLSRVDAALSRRDPDTMLTLADVASWRAAGRPSPDPAALVLPPTPLKRVRALSETDILYADDTARQWRVSLRGDDEHGWSVALHDRLCPTAGGMARGLEYQRPAQPETQGTWTPVECWPLPK